MVRLVWIINIILGCFEFNVDHFVQHATLCPITDDMLSQLLYTPVTLLPQLLMATSSRANPQSILQTKEPVNSFLYGLRFSVMKTVDDAGTTRLDDLLMWLQKW